MQEVIQFSKVSKAYDLGIGKKRVSALSDLTFSVETGEVFGYVGPNGAGKSTTIKLMLNLIFPDKGDIRIFNKKTDNVELKRDIGYLPEIPYYYDYLTPEELAWFSGKVALMSEKEIKKRSDELFERLLFQDHRKKRIKELSKGNAQKAGIVATLVHNPKLLILDEPMTGLDPIGRKLVSDIIMELKAKGHTVFLTSHILSDVEKLCDTIAIIKDGGLKVCEKKETLLKAGKTLEDLFCETIGLERKVI